MVFFRKEKNMIIDTRNEASIVDGLSKLFNFSKKDFYAKIDTLKNNAQYGPFFKENFFDEEIENFLNINIQNLEELDEIYVYHLTRTKEEKNISIYSLDKVLLTENFFSNFLKEYGISFKKYSDGIHLYYQDKDFTQNLILDKKSNSEKNVCSCYLLKRLGFTTKLDNCINGIFVSPTLYTDSFYYASLRDCPEILRNICNYFDINEMKRAYKLNTKYYCFIFKEKIENVIFDVDEKYGLIEKKKIFIKTLIKLLICNKDNKYKFDDEILYVRLDDKKTDIKIENIISLEENND